MLASETIFLDAPQLLIDFFRLGATSSPHLSLVTQGLFHARLPPPLPLSSLLSILRSQRLLQSSSLQPLGLSSGRSLR